jgi:cyclic pyranopterin phosphate synthase
MLDQYGRRIHYLRISLTDKCNLRCRYCLPHGVRLVSMQDILTMEEIAMVARCGAALGIDRIKLTGGEPLVRRGILQLMEMLREIEGIQQITMTTNGLLLRQYLPELTARGLAAVNISLDTLDPDIYRQITGYDGVQEVMAAVDAAISAGLKVKINAVLIRDINAHEAQSLIMLAKDNDIDIRFIELMPFSDEGENAQLIVTGDEILQQFPFLEYTNTEGTARYYSANGFKGRVGLINPVTHKFCGECNRVRLLCDGKVKPCLGYDTAYDIMPYINNEEQLVNEIKNIILKKPEGHNFENENPTHGLNKTGG